MELIDYIYKFVKFLLLRIESEEQLTNRIGKAVKKGRLKVELLQLLCEKLQCFFEQKVGDISSEKEAETITSAFLFPYFENFGELNRQQKSGNGFIDLMVTIFKKQNFLSEFPTRKILFELKIGYSKSYIEKGLKRIKDYIDTERLNYAFYFVFHDTIKFKIGEQRTRTIAGKKIYIYYIKIKFKKH